MPVSLIGTFAGLLALGYSINTLTLFGMVLAIGIVVDDAIVVLENVERIMREEHRSAREAAIKAMHEVTGPVIAIVLTLCAVFVPIAFLGGLTGELYRQFAVTIAIAVVISGLVALTLTPALCVLILKREHHQPGRFFRGSTDWFARVTNRYTDGVAWMLRRAVLIASRALRRHGGDHRGALARIPGLARARRGPGLLHRRGVPAGRRDARAHRQGRRAKCVESDPVQSRRTSTPSHSRASTSSAALSATARRRSSSPRSTGTSATCHDAARSASSSMKTGHIKEALVLAFNPPPIFGLGNAGGFEFYVQNRGEGGAKRLSEVSQQFLGARRKDPMFAQVNTLWRANVPQLYVDIDREKAKALGVPLDELYNTLAATLGSYYVNDFNQYGRTWQVLMSAEPRYRKTPDDIGDDLGALAEGRRWSRSPRSRTSSTRRAPTRSTASTTCRR